MHSRVVLGVVGLTAILASCGSVEPDAIAAADRAAPTEIVVPTSLSAVTTTTASAGPATTAAATTTATETRDTAPAVTVATTTNDPPPTTVPVAAPPPPPPTTAAPPPAPVGKSCVVSLHGKGGGPGPEWIDGNGVRHSFPGGNAPGWGGLQWLYYPASNYQTARNIVANDVAAGGCGRVIVYGFSNGAAFAAKLYCRGETFGGAVIGYVIDDPVVDHAVEGCVHPPVKVGLYWTGGIDVADGWPCGDWTCEGDSTIGIARYEAAIGVIRKQSPYTTHRPYSDPPEFHSWF